MINRHPFLPFLPIPSSSLHLLLSRDGFPVLTVSHSILLDSIQEKQESPEITMRKKGKESQDRKRRNNWKSTKGKEWRLRLSMTIALCADSCSSFLSFLEF
jgi:hypothetical protein